MQSKEIHKAKLTGKEALEFIEHAICEGLVTPNKIEGHPLNVFGKQVAYHTSESPDFAIGLAASGLRTGVIQDQPASEDHLQLAVRQQIPLVIHSIVNGLDGLSGSKAFQIVSTTVQEIADFSLIAHKIAELSLVPGIHTIEENDFISKTQQIDLPSKDDIENFIGKPGDIIDAPSPAQKIIFGQDRRRIPEWYNLDLPSQLGQKKDRFAHSLELASKNEFVFAHVSEIIKNVFAEYADLTGRNYKSINRFGDKKARHLVVSFGAAVNRFSAASVKMNGNKIGCLDIKVLHPFPVNELIPLIEGLRSVVVMEPINENQRSLAKIIRKAVSGKKNMPKVFSGMFAELPTEEESEAVVKNILADKVNNDFYLGIAFTNSKSRYPKHQVLLQNIDREYPELKDKSIIAEEVSEINSVSDSNELPLSVRQYHDKGPFYSRISDFHDHTALFYETGNQGELVADPYQSVPLVPSATAAFSGPRSARELIPIFKPENCTACGECFVHCPHAAIPPVALTVEQLIRAGIEIATSRGGQIISLIPAIKNLSNLTVKEFKKENKETLSFGEVLSNAFDELLLHIKPEGEKLDALNDDFKAVLSAIANLKVAATEKLFDVPESQEKGNGNLFTLAIDTSACTGCGICSDVCEEDALEMVPVDESNLSEALKNLKMWEILPDTSSEMINRLVSDETYNPFAALLLSRNFFMTMAGSAGDEMKSPVKQIMHLITAVSESIMQPRYARHVNDLKEQIRLIEENIHGLLSDSLPKENFEALQHALNKSDKNKIPFEEIVASTGEEEKYLQLDKKIISRKITLLDDLKESLWLITEGPSGTGKARFGIASDGNFLESVNHFPFNVFTSPVFINSQSSAELTIGLIEGQLHHILKSLRLLRKSKLEAKNKYTPKEQDKEFESLGLSSLDDEEKAMVPPILVFGDRNLFSQSGWNKILDLLWVDSPVKIFMIDDLAIRESDFKSVSVQNAQIVSLMASKKTFIFQGSMSDPGILFNGMVEGIRSATPAFFRLYSPSPELHSTSWNMWPGLCNLATNSRAIPYLRFNPEKFDGYLNSAIQLDDNPDPEANWYLQELKYDEEGETRTINYEVTWADWAFTLNDWQSHFTTYDGDEKPSIHVSEYIKKEQSGTENVVPVILRIKDNVIKKYIVSNEVVDMTRFVLEAWNMMREMSGTLTRFPNKLKKQVESEMKEQHADEIENLKKEFDNRLEEMEKKQALDLRQKLKDNLVKLINKKPTL